MDELLQQIERLAHANQALTQRLDREHSMRLAESERYEAEYALEHAGRKASERRAHEAEAALESLRAERNRNARLFPVRAHGYTVHDLAVASVCELLAAWGRFVDRSEVREGRAAIRSLIWGDR